MIEVTISFFYLALFASAVFGFWGGFVVGKGFGYLDGRHDRERDK